MSSDCFSGQIGYALVPMIARGVMLGPDQPVILHMLDIPFAAEALNGVKMELIDAAFPLLKGIYLICSLLKEGKKIQVICPLVLCHSQFINVVMNALKVLSSNE